MNNLRLLTEIEIQRLCAQQCRCENWQLVQVSEGFDANFFFNVCFSGKVELGCFNHVFTLKNGITKHAGIYHAHIHNCRIEDDVYIAHVANYIANYRIEAGAYIENVDLISTDEESTFGNGTEVALLDETGSRKLTIFDNLSAQQAYLLTLCLHKPLAIEKINKQIAQYVAAKKSALGYIGKRAYIVNCGTIKNIFIGQDAHLDSALLLQNGSINSTTQAPSLVGPGVIAKDFILSSGTKVVDGVQIERCFVGQGDQLGKQFSATDSVFFANCQGFHGEAVSVFAGPYTVTHHKSTLLIGGMFSFFNAGSGSNQSNHMYKLGPIHYGVVDRGSKMASDSYIPWPSRVGAFSVVMGKHKNKMDSSALPFSYLVAEGAETLIIPGINLLSIGTYRDVSKWPLRDCRRDDAKRDILVYPLFNPYTIQEVIRGKRLLTELLERNEGTDSYTYVSDKIKIKAEAVERGIKLYQWAINLYVGEIIFKKLQCEESLKADGPTYTEWMDLSGLIAPRELVNELLCGIERNDSNSLDEIDMAVAQFQQGFEHYEWNFVLSILPEASHITSTRKEELISFLSNKWIPAKNRLIEVLMADTKKEFSDSVKTVYGIDLNEEDKAFEFNSIRGSVADNAFLNQLIESTQNQIVIATKLKA